LLEKICFLVRKKFLTFTECFFRTAQILIIQMKIFFLLSSEEKPLQKV
jgi:hypothetical protein